MTIEEAGSQTGAQASLTSISYDVDVEEWLRQNLERQRVLIEQLKRSKEDILRVQKDIKKEETMGKRWPRVDIDIEKFLRERDKEALTEKGKSEESEASYDIDVGEWLRQNMERQRVLKKLLRRSKEDILNVQEDIKNNEAIGQIWPRVNIDIEEFLRERDVDAKAQVEDGEREEGNECGEGERAFDGRVRR